MIMEKIQAKNNSLYNTVEFGDRKIQISGSVLKFYIGKELIRAREVKDVNFAMEEFQQVVEKHTENFAGPVTKYYKNL
jgi:hypothetical protein